MTEAARPLSLPPAFAVAAGCLVVWVAAALGVARTPPEPFVLAEAALGIAFAVLAGTACWELTRRLHGRREEGALIAMFAFAALAVTAIAQQACEVSTTLDGRIGERVTTVALWIAALAPLAAGAGLALAADRGRAPGAWVSRAVGLVAVALAVAIDPLPPLADAIDAHVWADVPASAQRVVLVAAVLARFGTWAWLAARAAGDGGPQVESRAARRGGLRGLAGAARGLQYGAGLIAIVLASSAIAYGGSDVSVIALGRELLPIVLALGAGVLAVAALRFAGGIRPSGTRALVFTAAALAFAVADVAGVQAGYRWHVLYDVDLAGGYDHLARFADVFAWAEPASLLAAIVLLLIASRRVAAAERTKDATSRLLLAVIAIAGVATIAAVAALILVELRAPASAMAVPAVLLLLGFAVVRGAWTALRDDLARTAAAPPAARVVS